jgi:intracellular multiplication protein IcmL
MSTQERSDRKQTTKTEKSRPSRADPIISISKRNRELEKRTQRALLANLTLTLALTVSVAGNVILGTRKAEPRYFAQNEQTGALTQIVPLNKPISSKASVIQHVADTVGDVYALDFANYQGQLQRASSSFTSKGWERFIAEFEASGNIDAMLKKQLVVSGVISKPPVIVREGEIFGALFWDLQVPYSVRYQGAGFDQTQNLVAFVKVVRVPTTENPRGIAIAQFVAKAG